MYKYFNKIIAIIVLLIFAITTVEAAECDKKVQKVPSWVKLGIAGAIIGAIVDKKKPLRGALKGGGLGIAAQILREEIYGGYDYGYPRYYDYPSYYGPRYYERRESKCANEYCEEHYYSSSPYGYSYSEQYYGNGRSYYYFERKEW
jgi:hypothetical protein